MERVEREEITGATLRNFVKAIKLFCEMSDAPISGDPKTYSGSFVISEGLRSVLLDFLKDKKIEISEDELDDMGVMVYSPKMREAGKDPTEISGSSSLQ
jgi:hypothetical protein